MESTMKNTIRVLAIVAAVWVLAIMAVCLSGCKPTPTPDPTPSPIAVERNKWSPLIAVAAAEAAMQEESTPAPLPLPPEPDDTDDDSGEKPGGPLGLLRDARALVDKGNKLADRGKSILDKAEQEGKITIDVRLPGAAKAEKPQSERPDGSCQLPPNDQRESTADDSRSVRGPIRRLFRRRR